MIGIKSKISGFTLIELLVSISVFSVLVTLIGGTFVHALALQRRAFAIQSIQENASFILEAMAKELRVATIIDPQDAPCPRATLQVQNQEAEDIQYSLSGTDVIRQINGTETTMNSNAVKFTRLQFCVMGSTLTDQQQPRVTIIATIQAAHADQLASVDVQDTVSLRMISD